MLDYLYFKALHFFVGPTMIQAELRKVTFCNLLEQCENNIEGGSSGHRIKLELRYFFTKKTVLI